MLCTWPSIAYFPGVELIGMVSCKCHLFDVLTICLFQYFAFTFKAFNIYDELSCISDIITCIDNLHRQYCVTEMDVLTKWTEFFITAGFHSPTASIVLLSLLMLEAVIFGIFTGVMFFNQMWAVSTDETVNSAMCDLIVTTHVSTVEFFNTKELT